MAGNAYALRGLPNWYDVDDAWNTSFPFGWEEGEGFRGHVFLSSDNNTIVLSIKGTTVQGPTSRLDKYNDNLLFSCCCARHAWVMRTVCDCFGSGWKCDDRCLSDALIQDSLFYSVGTKLIDDLIHIYPNANLWLVGHSLGGALASLLGATYGLPAIAFESPGERLAAQRLHLPMPPTEVPPPEEESISPALRSVLHRLPILEMFLGNPRVPRAPPPPPPHAASITHVYHTADPIPFGTCNGPYSICATGGYALETKCHLGKSIILDTVNRMKWLVDVRKHVIKQVVQLLDMPEEGEDGVDWGEEGGGDDDDDDDEPDPCKGGDWCLQQRVLSTLRGWDSVVPGGWGPGRGKKNKKKKGGDGDEKKPISNRVPKPIIESDCVDCFRWEFGSYKDELKAQS
ncbi:alpha/beta-hydrolase [Coprinellus micaceus]|uniref:triacylglycerol lipase n=1 Tax=Coprinellus micaceus TaxID=71717 RepID=A0A4Y7TZQ1_COPMI|nr:alpha/beta-hydrolase [Coprinellus micaceus]